MHPHAMPTLKIQYDVIVDQPGRGDVVIFTSAVAREAYDTYFANAKLGNRIRVVASVISTTTELMNYSD